MSGIAGIYYLDGRPVERMDVQRMVDSIAHRGPDGCGVWTDGSVGLGHRMLWTTPESLHEKLPLTNKTGDLTITADARIDNREELFSALNFNGRPRETITDSKLILAAYEKWGEKCPEKLLGDFSFAIWDKRNQKIYCARDHMGVKPFYYYHSNKVFVFASEIKALLSLREIPRRLNEVMVAYYLISMFEDKTITFYQDILRLPPAHIMKVDSGRTNSNQYWSLDPSRELKLSSDDEYAEAFRDIFREAVRCRLRSTFPVGSMLSGGLDSSSIVCIARQILSQNGGGQLHTFSAIFDDVPQCDERPYINAVLSGGGLEPHYVHADRISPLTDLDYLFLHEDQAHLGPNLFIHWGLYKAAHEVGIRMLLDGVGGDTTISHGIAYLTELARKWRWKTLITEVKKLSKHLSRPFWKILWHRAINPFVPETVRGVWRILRGKQYHLLWGMDNIITSKFARRICLEDRLQTLQAEKFKSTMTEREDHWQGLTSGLNQSILEMADRAAAAFSLEPRYPFLDKHLIELCFDLPPEQKLHQGWSRMVMRRGLANILPLEIQWRGGKADLSTNFIRGLLTFESGRLEKLMLKDLSLLADYVNTIRLRAIYNRCLSHNLERDSLVLWSVLTLALWLRCTGLKTGIIVHQ